MVIVDLEKAEQMAMAGCSGKEIAEALGVHPDTLYRRVVDTFGVPNYSAWSQAKKAKGDALLKVRQFDRAMAGSETMLRWLGIQRLGQRARVDHAIAQPDGQTVITRRVVDANGTELSAAEVQSLVEGSIAAAQQLADEDPNEDQEDHPAPGGEPDGRAA